MPDIASGSIQTINPDLEAMAQLLGASRLRAFFDVVVPLSLPGVLSGSILVFAMTVSSYVLPILVGGFRVIITPMPNHFFRVSPHAPAEMNASHTAPQRRTFG